MSAYSPWRDLRSRPEIDLDRRPFPDSERRRGWCEPGRITLDHLMRRAQARCVLAHEIAHLDLGHLAIDPSGMVGGRYLASRQEAEADRLAASRLITIDELVDGLLWAAPGDWWQLADACNVTVRIAQVRCGMVHDDEAEQAVVTARMKRREVAA